MKTSIALILSASLLTLAGCDQMQPSQTAGDPAGTADMPAATTGKVLATINGSAITQSVLDVYMEIRNTQNPNKAADEATVLEELISLELMRQEGISKGLNTQPAVAASLDQQQRTVLASAAIKDFLSNNPVSDETAKELYDNQIGKAGMEYNARHILVTTQEEATEIIKQLDNGGNFEELAKEKSTGPSGKTGGKLGWFAPAQMVKPFSDATAKLEKGAYTKEPVQTQFGWHVILLEDSREITPPAFEDVKDRVKLVAANQQLQAHIQQLRQSASIEITADAAGAAPADDATTAEESAPAGEPSEESSADAGEPTPGE
ncbi:MAG: peptidylprolyl isomerase [Gammaproteobacteria bacterium]|nr:peptidylprolyl isomerase [Gammaproteobacteria bacterium]